MVVKIILPVIAQAKREHQILAWMVFILGEQSDHFFQKDDVAVPLLLHERERTALGIVS